MATDQRPSQGACHFDGEEDTVCTCVDCMTRMISRAWEVVTGYDSIQTIERVYTRRSGGAYECIWPGCTVARVDPAVIWRHIHAKHDGNTLPPADFDWRAVDVG